MGLYYYKDMFKVENMKEAKKIILTEEAQGGDYSERWERETKYMLNLFKDGLGDLNGKIILDFGCGIGRLSKVLLEKFDCHVLGVDISSSMRKLSLEYVRDDRFSVLSYELFCKLVREGKLKVDIGLAVYVLQHVYDPEHDIEILGKALREKIFILNLIHRAIPVIDSETGVSKFCMYEKHEAKDDVGKLLEKQFITEKEFILDNSKISIAEKHWCKVYKVKYR